MEPLEEPEEDHPVSSRESRSRGSPSPEGRRPPSAKCPVCRALQPPWAAEVDKAYTEGGIHLDAAPSLTERLRRLVAADEGSENFVWVVVESCTDCAQHGPSVRHDETNYFGRFQKLKDRILDRFPTGIGVALLVEPKGEAKTDEEPKKSERGADRLEPTRRIGSFEVYMCCEAPLRPWGAFPLSQLEPDFNCVTLSSKLKSRAWPSLDAVMKRLCASMPQVMVHVAVHNELEWPLPFAQLTVQAADHSVIANGETDKDGHVSVQVPLFTPLTLKAGRASLMDFQERLVEIVAPDTPVTFLAETAVQLWQRQTSMELIVYCCDPRLDPEEKAVPDLIPFQGQIEYTTGEALRGDADGILKGRPDPLKDADFVSCTGWRSSPLSDRAVQAHGTGRLVEVARLGVPIVEVSLVTRCCQSCVAGAQISVDGQVFGRTEASGVVSCGVRMGEHTVVAEHMFLPPEGLSMPLSIVGSQTCGVQMELPMDCLRFVCAAAPGTRAPQEGEEALADLWLVGGDLAAWRGSRWAPPVDAEVWLWDGELQSSSWGSLRVSAGVVSRHWRTGRSRDGLDDGPPDDLEGGGSPSSRPCILADALAAPVAGLGPWQVVLHAARGGSECALARLARLTESGAPAIWLARLAPEAPPEDGETSDPPMLHVSSSCCGAGVVGVGVTVNGDDAGCLGEDGLIQLPGNCKQCTIGLTGVPASLLPGGATEFVAELGRGRRPQINLETLLWVYWWLPEPDEDDEEQADEIQEDAMVFVCANPEQIPDEARPVTGVLHCASGEEPEIRLDGTTMGPILLRRSRLQHGGDCLVSELLLDVDPPEGFRFVPRMPSPLAVRHEELGGCELQRLTMTPTVLGDLRATAPRPRPPKPKVVRAMTYEDAFEDEEEEEAQPPAAASPWDGQAAHTAHTDDAFEEEKEEDEDQQAARSRSETYDDDAFEDEDQQAARSRSETYDDDAFEEDQEDSRVEEDD